MAMPGSRRRVGKISDTYGLCFVVVSIDIVWSLRTGEGLSRQGKEARKEDIPRQRAPTHIIHHYEQIDQRDGRFAAWADFRGGQTGNVGLVDGAVDHENDAHDGGADDQRLATSETVGEENDEESAGDDFDGAEDAG